MRDILLLACPEFIAQNAVSLSAVLFLFHPSFGPNAAFKSLLIPSQPAD